MTRRIVTGQRADGKSVVVSDEVVQAKEVTLLPGSTFTQLWGSDECVQLPSDGTQPEWTTFFPPERGFRFLLWTVPPEGTQLPADIDVAAAFEELQRDLPGLVEFNEPDQPGMHTTHTVDLDVVISGELWLELDDGAEVHLKAGDTVIQNGTRHAWHNKTSEVTTMLTALVGARRS
jgi:hypothetical protein